MLVAKNGPNESLVVTGARVLDPAQGVDAQLDVRVDDGVIAQLGTALERNGHRLVDGTGLVLAPAFVDPHVHLRGPGREDEETIASGTAAAAAGGYCAILAMPNTEPVIDSAAVLGSLINAQVTNGVAVRMAVLYDILAGRDADLSDPETAATPSTTGARR